MAPTPNIGDDKSRYESKEKEKKKNEKLGDSITEQEWSEMNSASRAPPSTSHLEFVLFLSSSSVFRNSSPNFMRRFIFIITVARILRIQFDFSI